MPDSPDHKTLVLKRQPGPPKDTQQEPRKRSGARARQAALQERARQATRTPQSEPEQPQRRPKPVQIFQVFAPCPHGLEQALTQELLSLGFESAIAGRAGCHFQASWQGIMQANLHSRLATRILVRVAQARIHTEDDILELARQTPWEHWFGPQQTLRVDTSAIRSPVRSLQYCNLRAKDGICDRLRAREGARPDIDTVRPDARVHLFLEQQDATLYIDVSGESLFKRGWRLDKGEAPLRENLAAGLLTLAQWPTDAPLLDPFCGSGTILIEAAWMALGVPPGIWRPFAFERLRVHDPRLWRDVKDDARARILPQLEQPIVGVDTDPGAIEAARANAERAHLGPLAIQFQVGDARQLPPPAPRGWIVTNPPYGERMDASEDDLWPQWARQLKQYYDGWSVHIITSDLELPSRLRLKAQRRIPIYNGALDCRFFRFDITGSQRQDVPSTPIADN